MGVLVRNKINYSGSGDILIPTNYSLEEQRIGTWVDGKPLYQKTVVASQNYTIANDSWTDISDLNSVALMINYLVDFKVLTVDTQNNACAIREFECNLRRGSSAKIQLLSLRTGADSISSGSYITLRYTKTTD